MAIDNDELMRKFVRTGMIMRHIDGEGAGHRKRGGRYGEGREKPSAPDGGRAPDMRSAREGEHKGQRRRGQMRVIVMVAMREGISQKDLAFLLGIRPQTLGEMLQKLEAHDLVERRKSETDGRVIEVYLTDEGRARAAEIAERRKLVAADLFAVLTDEEKEQLAAILDKLGAELDKHRPKHHGHGHGPNREGDGEARAESGE